MAGVLNDILMGLAEPFAESEKLEAEIRKNLAGVGYGLPVHQEDTTL